MNDSRGLFAQPGNFAGLPSPLSDLNTARVCILPVPYDSTTEWHSGTRNGPKSIIEASFYLEMYDIELGREICDIGIHTLPALEPVLSSPEAMADRVYQAVKSLLDQSKFIAMLGGEHSISYGAVRAFKRKISAIYPSCNLMRIQTCGTSTWEPNSAMPASCAV